MRQDSSPYGTSSEIDYLPIEIKDLRGINADARAMSCSRRDEEVEVAEVSRWGYRPGPWTARRAPGGGGCAPAGRCHKAGPRPVGTSVKVPAEVASRHRIQRLPHLDVQVAMHLHPGEHRHVILRRDRQQDLCLSLGEQLHTYREEVTRLRAENHELCEQLARRLGPERTAAITSRS